MWSLMIDDDTQQAIFFRSPCLALFQFYIHVQPIYGQQAEACKNRSTLLLSRQYIQNDKTGVRDSHGPRRPDTARMSEH